MDDRKTLNTAISNKNLNTAISNMKILFSELSTDERIAIVESTKLLGICMASKYNIDVVRMTIFADEFTHSLNSLVSPPEVYDLSFAMIIMLFSLVMVLRYAFSNQLWLVRRGLLGGLIPAVQTIDERNITSPFYKVPMRFGRKVLNVANATSTIMFMITFITGIASLFDLYTRIPTILQTVDGTVPLIPTDAELKQYIAFASIVSVLSAFGLTKTLEQLDIIEKREPTALEIADRLEELARQQMPPQLPQQLPQQLPRRQQIMPLQWPQQLPRIQQIIPQQNTINQNATFNKVQMERYTDLIDTAMADMLYTLDDVAEELIECAVCRERYNTHDRKPQKLSTCGHIFCEYCVATTREFAESLNKIYTCPLCNQVVSSSDTFTDLNNLLIEFDRRRAGNV